MTTEPGMLEPGKTFPKIRDYDSYTYAREWENGSILIGGFEPEAKPAFTSSRKIPKEWQQQLPEDWKHFSTLLKLFLLFGYFMFVILLI